jgi:SynChlorMet cassette protein ScmC
MKRSKRTWNVQRCIPLSAIFFLEQAENDEVVAMGNGEAAVSISNSIKQVLLRTQYYMDREEVKSSRLKLFDNACELARKIPAYRLRITKSGRFWEEIEKVL